MVSVKRVETKKEARAFVNFPLKLYEGNPYYAPLFYADELKLLSEKTNIYGDYTESAFFLARDEKGKVVGRIGAIVNYADIEKTGVKSVRFTRLDAIDDFSVFAALFEAVETYAKEKGIYLIQGPLGYNDLDKEGLLIQGFDLPENYGGVYNYSYYQTHIEALGYEKAFDWLERRLKVPAEVDERYQRTAELVAKKYGFHELVEDKMKTKTLLDRFADGIFRLVDEAYEKLHGTVPLTENAKKSLLDGLKFIIKARYLSCVADRDGNMIAFGLMLPSIGGALNRSKGKLFPTGIFHFLPLLFKKTTELEMALIAVKPEFQNSGVNAMVVTRLWKNVIEDGIFELESNANLEDNFEINNFMNKFEGGDVIHKRRRCYKRELV